MKMKMMKMKMKMKKKNLYKKFIKKIIQVLYWKQLTLYFIVLLT